MTCPSRAVGYCGPCTVRLLISSREKYPAGKLQCKCPKSLISYFQWTSNVGPCCRQIGYLISKEWIFVQNEEARDAYKKQYKKEKNKKRKARAKEEKLTQQGKSKKVKLGSDVYSVPVSMHLNPGEGDHWVVLECTNAYFANVMPNVIRNDHDQSTMPGQCSYGRSPHSSFVWWAEYGELSRIWQSCLSSEILIIIAGPMYHRLCDHFIDNLIS